MKGTRILTMAAVLPLFTLAACGTEAASEGADDTWAKEAQVGEHTPEEQDWQAIEAAAKEEGEVTIYSVSSRMQDFGEAFEQKYGIKVSFAELPSSEQTERYQREYEAGIRGVDVLYNNDPATMIESFLPKGMVHNFVPDMVRDKLAEADAEPILNQRWTGRVFIYNSANNDEAPIDSLWDLTREEWKGRFQLPDPATDGASAESFLTVLQHPEEMAAAYEREFGEPLEEYSEAVESVTGQNPVYNEPDAAIEWLHRVLQNEPVFVESTTDISDTVGDVNTTTPRIGMTTFSKIRGLEPGVVEWQPAYDLDPVVGVFYSNVLAIADEAPHPNAAKLVIRELMTAEGFEPWNEPGDYATNSDIAAAQAQQFGDQVPALDELNAWFVDSAYTHGHRRAFLQLYLGL